MFYSKCPNNPVNCYKYKIEGINGKKCLSISNSTIEFHPPYALENDVDEIFTKADRVIDRLESSIPDGQRSQSASAAWHSSAGMGMATKVFANEICQHLDRVPPIALNHQKPPRNPVAFSAGR
jgi:hypothetical protein